MVAAAAALLTAVATLAVQVRLSARTSELHFGRVVPDSAVVSSDHTFWVAAGASATAEDVRVMVPAWTNVMVVVVVVVDGTGVGRTSAALGTVAGGPRAVSLAPFLSLGSVDDIGGLGMFA